MRKIVCFLIALLGFTKVAAQDPADFVLPSIISDHAVMQRDATVKLWGWCPSVWDLKIVCSWAPNDTIHAKSDKLKYWEAFIDTPKEEGPHTIKFYGWENKLFAEVKDILMGETWLCSGQSNMEYCFRWRVDDIKDRTTFFDNKKIRFFQVNKSSSAYPVERIQGEWKIASLDNIEDFSVVAYCFGKQLNAGLDNVPVGLIGSYWGGTGIEPWMETFMLHHENLDKLADKIEPSWAPTAKSSLYNAMIYPIINYTFKGVIWYQGEANNERASDYGVLFDNMIRGWRNATHRYLPFYFVQIAPWNGYADKNAAYLREQQADVAATLRNTGMVVVSDLVNDISDIHPSLKRQVGERLANLALKQTYHKADLNPFSPMLKSFKVEKNKVIVTTTAVGKLSCKDKEIKHFEIVDKDGNLHPAQAVILKNGDIAVSAKGVKVPTGVRYCFTNDAMPNVFDVNGLPLAPFRTDRGK